ncbi:hypothetical protein D9M72_536980 [compost metagenome]
MRPPGHNRSVGEQEGGNERLAFLGELTVAAEYDHFGRAGVAAHADLGVQPGGGLGTGIGEDDDPAGVFPAGFVGRFDGLFFQPGLGDHHEGEHPSEGDHAALLAQGHDLLGDLRGCSVGKIYDHGLLQVRPSRASSSSAEAGPQLPGA